MAAAAAASGTTSPAATQLIQAAGEQPVLHAGKAWEFFRSIGSPKFHVAPMVDQSELPFRRLCRKYGATCAYTPMLHARLFCEDARYRSEIFTTCEGDRPLFIQFCANDPDYLVRAARMLETQGDAIDINFGCPQRIAKRGNYGAYLMDNLQLVEQLVTKLAQGIKVPVTCKIRVFPRLEDTLAYARMIQAAGCSVLAVHGRTREQKDLASTRADWDQIKAVKQALSIPVLANGNIRHLQDALDCMAYTGADGVLSAESLLEDPALFSPQRLLPGGARRTIDGIQHCIEYLQNCLETPTHMRMVKGHVHRLCGPWLAEHIDLRAEINRGHLDIAGNLRVMQELAARVKASGREEPIPAVNPKHLERQRREEARKAAIEEQEREAAALLAIGAVDSLAVTAGQPVVLQLVGASADQTPGPAQANGGCHGDANAQTLQGAMAAAQAQAAGVQAADVNTQGPGEACGSVDEPGPQGNGHVCGGVTTNGEHHGEGEGELAWKKRRADSAGNVAGLAAAGKVLVDCAGGATTPEGQTASDTPSCTTCTDCY